MMNTQISNTNRFQSADAVGTLMNCILNTTKNSWQFKKMDRNNNIHLQNVRYLLNRLDAAESNEEKNREEVAVSDYGLVESMIRDYSIMMYDAIAKP